MKKIIKLGNSTHDPYDAGMGTTPGMWEYLSEILAEEHTKLPESLNNAIYSLRDGHAIVIKTDRMNNKKTPGIKATDLPQSVATAPGQMPPGGLKEKEGGTDHGE